MTVDFNRTAWRAAIPASGFLVLLVAAAIAQSPSYREYGDWSRPQSQYAEGYTPRGGARTNWVDASYGVWDMGGEGYGHEWDNERQKAQRSAKIEDDRQRNLAFRDLQQQNAEAARQREASARSMPTKTDGFISTSGQGLKGMTQDEAMRSTLPAAARSATLAAPAERVDSIQGMTAIGVGAETFYYKDGVFHELRGGQAVPVKAPVGAYVFDIPAAAQRVENNGDPYYEFNGVRYQKVMAMGEVVYKVVYSGS